MNKSKRLSVEQALYHEWLQVIGIQLFSIFKSSFHLSSSYGGSCYVVLLKEILLKIGFIVEMRSTWGNKEVGGVPYLFSLVGKIRLIRSTSVPLLLATQQFVILWRKILRRPQALAYYSSPKITPAWHTGPILLNSFSLSYCASDKITI